MTLTLELPDETAAKLAAKYPERGAQMQFAESAITEALEYEAREEEEISEVVNAVLDDLDAGGKTYSLEEMRKHWDELRSKHRKATAR